MSPWQSTKAFSMERIIIRTNNNRHSSSLYLISNKTKKYKSSRLRTISTFKRCKNLSNQCASRVKSYPKIPLHNKQCISNLTCYRLNSKCQMLQLLVNSTLSKDSIWNHLETHIKFTILFWKKEENLCLILSVGLIEMAKSLRLLEGTVSSRSSGAPLSRGTLACTFHLFHQRNLLEIRKTRLLILGASV